jgi:hypothetical protein
MKFFLIKSFFLQIHTHDTLTKKKSFYCTPVCYEVKRHEENVLNLNETLYGLKQAWRAWYSRIDDKEGIPPYITLFTIIMFLLLLFS